MSVFLPSLPTDRLRWSRGCAGQDRSDEAPLATAVTLGNRPLVVAVNRAAEAAGVRPGLPLADARAFLPDLAVVDADPAADAALLARLAEWCRRWTPWVATDGVDGLLLDVTGCAHLRGGEARLGAEVADRLQRLGFAARVAIADAPAAAWAVAHFAPAAVSVVPPGGTRDALASLPVAALRLAPAVAMGLDRLGLSRIGDLHGLGRAALVRRFGADLARRLDQALGAAGEPVSPRRERLARRARLAYAEPIVSAEAIAAAVAHLADALCRALAAEGIGARRVELACYRVDGATQRLAIGTAAPSRDPRHLAKLFAEKLATIEPALGIEEMVLEAPVAEPLAAGQGELPSLPRAADKRPSPRPVPPTPRPPGLRLVAGGAPPPLPDLADDDALPWQKRRPKRPVVAALVAPEGAARLAPLVDRLGNRLGLARLHRLVPVESHVPERAQRAAPLFEPLLAGWPTGTPRPVRLLDPPEPIEVTAPVPDDPPVAFRWRRRHRRVRRADGPERIASEWWRRVSPPDARAIRDYYRIEDEDGRRFWVFRAGLYEAGTPPLWYLHGVFP